LDAKCNVISRRSYYNDGMKLMRIGAIVGLALVVLAACAPGPNAMKGAGDAEGDVAGFLDGLWHGIIVPVTFVVSLFSDGVNVYDVNNNGGWYNLGFIIGLTVPFGGGCKGASGGRKRRG
jgi:hypothetical protein